MRLNLVRHAALFLAASAIAACGTLQVNDTNAAVDANPLCTSQPSQPGEPVASECEPVARGATRSRRPRAKATTLAPRTGS